MVTTAVYRSKIGWEILIPMVLILGIVIVLTVVNGAWLALAICGLVVAFIIHLWTGTTYSITADHRLLIKCGVLEKFDIDIQEIKSIKKSNELTNAPALSVDRIEISYNGGRVLISPRDKLKFVKELKNINPKIWWTSEPS
jgi:hypothetical protein